MRKLPWAAAALSALAIAGSSQASMITYTSQTRSVEAMVDVNGMTDSDSFSAVDFGPFPATAIAEVDVDMDNAFASASTASALESTALSASGSVNASRIGDPASASATSLFIVEFTLQSSEIFDIGVGATNATWSISGPGGVLYQTGDEDLDLMNVPLDAGDYTVSFETTASVDFEEGTQVATGSWSVTLTLVPAPGIPSLAGLAALVAMRRRR